MKLILAIDPGASGGYAVKHGSERVYALPMPETTGDLVEALGKLRQEADDCVAYVERVGGYRKGVPAPGSAMFNFGFGAGVLEGVLMAQRWKLVYVRPQEWQKRLFLGHRGDRTQTDWKNHLKAAAQRLYPELSVTKKIADCLLIAAYAIGEELNGLRQECAVHGGAPGREPRNLIRKRASYDDH